MERKKTVLIQTDHTLAKTGFGRSARALFEYLFKTGKYKLINFAIGALPTPDLGRTPWLTIPSVNPQQVDEIKRQNDPKTWEQIERMAGYGAFQLDAAINEHKPDVFIGIQDIWGIDFSVDKPWFKKIPSLLWTTLDSLPILPKAVDLAPKIKDYWSWADFATQALHKLGHKHVKTVRGAIETKFFFRLPDIKRKELRERFGIPSDVFIIGFVFRNQLRKSVPNLVEGFKEFQKANPKTKAKLLLHTCWTEGWDIPKLLGEYDVKKEDVLTTYVCKHCKGFHIKSFEGPEQNCNLCGAQNGQVTTGPTIGVSEDDLNLVYNLMDVYCHPFTSGGQEIPVQEAKLTELITLVTNYSCGEDLCDPAAASLPLEYAEYREPGTQFIKASTYPSSIAKQLTKVLNMDSLTRRDMGKKARQWTIDNFSVEVIGGILERYLDTAPFTEYAFDDKPVAKDPYYSVPAIKDDSEWVLHIYHNILKMPVDVNDGGYKHWMQRLKEGMQRRDIEDYFRKTAFAENQKAQVNQVKFEDLLNKNDKGRVLMVLPESAGDIFLASSLFKSIKERYPEWAFYVATKTQFRDIVISNPYVDRWIEYNPMMDNLVWLEGNNNHNGFFDVAYLAHASTQRFITYYHNGKDKLDVKLT